MKVTVQTAPKSVALNITNKTIDLSSNERIFQLVGTISPSTANVYTHLKYTSSDKTVADVDENTGRVTAITNILKNCIEHSYENRKIYINYNQNNMYTELKIEDNGTGIDAKDLPHIFERFYKGKNSSSDSVGIGLALSKSIIESNNGYIQVDSKLNKGTTFIIKYLK